MNGLFLFFIIATAAASMIAALGQADHNANLKRSEEGHA